MGKEADSFLDNNTETGLEEWTAKIKTEATGYKGLNPKEKNQIWKNKYKINGSLTMIYRLVAQAVKRLSTMWETWIGKIPWRRKWQSTPVLLPWKSHGRRSLVGCSPGRLGVGHDWGTSLSLFTSMHWRRKWQPIPVFLPGWRSMGSHRVKHDWSDLAAAAAALVSQW